MTNRSTHTRYNQPGPVGRAVFMMCLICGTGGAAALCHAEDKLPAPQSLISSVRASEQLLENVHVVSRLAVAEYDEQTGQWQTTPVQVVAETWYDGTPGGKARMEIIDEVLKWTGGPAPYSRNKISYGFDGQMGRIAHHAMGTLDQRTDGAMGEIAPTRPAALDTAFYQAASGSLFTTHYRFASDRKSFSTMLQDLSDSGAFSNGRTRIDRDSFAGFDAIRVSSGDVNANHEAFWLSPAHGYALVGYREVRVNPDSAAVFETQDTVVNLREVAPGLWYPTEAYRQSGHSSSAGSASRRWHYSASEAAANSPALAGSQTYKVQFPPNYSINDRILNRVYNSTETPDILQRDLDHMVDVIRGMQTPSPAPERP